MTGTLVSTYHLFPCRSEKKRHWTKALSNVCSLLCRLVSGFCLSDPSALSGMSNYQGDIKKCPQRTKCIYTKIYSIKLAVFLAQMAAEGFSEMSSGTIPCPKGKQTLYLWILLLFCQVATLKRLLILRSKNLGQSIFRKQVSSQ